MIKELVSQYATKSGKTVDVNLKALAKDKDFREEAIAAVLKRVEAKSPTPCVIVPAFDSASTENHLGSLINELALNLQIKALVTGDVSNIKSLRVRPEAVLIIKQSFRTGKGLQDQIEDLKAQGVGQVSVLCFISHNSGRMQGFGHENGVDIEALVATDDIRYLEG